MKQDELAKLMVVIAAVGLCLIAIKVLGKLALGVLLIGIPVWYFWPSIKSLLNKGV